MAEANTSALAYIAESTWGTTPGTPELTEIRMLSDDLAHSKNTVESAELRSDRMTADLAEVGAAAGGTFAFELSYLSFEPFFESAFYSSFTTISETIASLDIAAQVITGAASDFDNLLVGGWIKIAGATTSSNNGFKRIIAKAGDGSTITFAAGSLSGSDTGETLTFTAGDLRNGVTEKSFTMERMIPHDGTDYFQVFTGMVAAQMSLNIQTQQIATGSFGFVGKSGAAGASTIDNAGGYTASNNNSVMNGTANVGSVYMDDYSATTPTVTAIVECIKQVTFDVNNNVRGLDKLGTTGNFDLGSGTMDLTGTMEMYFASNDFFSDFIAHTYKSFAMEIADGAGNTYILTLPRINFSEANPALAGKNTDVMQAVQWRAIRDTLTGAQMIINKFDA